MTEVRAPSGKAGGSFGRATFTSLWLASAFTLVLLLGIFASPTDKSFIGFTLMLMPFAFGIFFLIFLWPSWTIFAIVARFHESTRPGRLTAVIAAAGLAGIAVAWIFLALCVPSVFMFWR